MFYATLMITTNEIYIKCTQKEMRREQKHVITKSQLNTKESSKGGDEEQKAT